MQKTVTPGDLDLDRLEALRGLFTPEELSSYYSALIDDITDFIQHGPSASAFFDQAHAQLGAALNLGALRIAGTLRAVEGRPVDLRQALDDLDDALVALRPALERHGVT